MNDWQQIYEFYTEVSQNPRPSWQDTAIHAQGILRLLPHLEEHDYFKDVIVGTAHVTLYVAHPQQPHQVVCIWAMSLERYKVYYLSNADLSMHTETEVSSDAIVGTLIHYLENLAVKEESS